jgi:SAM-dependent methyltransferase
MDPAYSALVDAATRPFLPAGRYPWHFARGKLRHDPVFLHLLRYGQIPDGGRLLDLGCGYGLLPALLLAAQDRYRCGDWPADWPPPPLDLDLHGVELRPDRVQAARAALGRQAAVEQGDLRTAPLPASAVIVILDVLLYLDHAQQRAVLSRVMDALLPGGVLLLREADAAGGFPYHVTRCAERFAGMGRGRPRQALTYRAAGQWQELLVELGFTVRAQRMDQGTPFCNVLFVATKGASPAAGGATNCPASAAGNLLDSRS